MQTMAVMCYINILSSEVMKIKLVVHGPIFHSADIGKTASLMVQFLLQYFKREMKLQNTCRGYSDYFDNIFMHVSFIQDFFIY